MSRRVLTNSAKISPLISFARRFPDAVCLLALAVLCAVVFWPLLSGQTYYYGDSQLYFQPMATFWRSHLVQGRVPLWNAGILGGTPFVGSPQMWILYPLASAVFDIPSDQSVSDFDGATFLDGGRVLLRLDAARRFEFATVWRLCWARACGCCAGSW